MNCLRGSAEPAASFSEYDSRLFVPANRPPSRTRALLEKPKFFAILASGLTPGKDATAASNCRCRAARFIRLRLSASCHEGSVDLNRNCLSHQRRNGIPDLAERGVHRPAEGEAIGKRLETSRFANRDRP